MRIGRVRLTNVRCHTDIELALGPSLNIVVGGNGTGKSSLLEAICLALRGTSPRTRRPVDCIRSGQEFLRVEVELVRCASGLEADQSTKPARTTAAAAFDRLGDRRLWADDRVLGSVERWRHMVQLETFFPDDLLLIKGSPRRRREFLDDRLVAHSSEYAVSLRRYEKALEQRNALLRRGALGEQHGPWEAILAEEGVAIVRTRARELTALAPTLTSVHARLCGRREPVLRVAYRTNAADLDVDAYRRALQEQREGDSRRSFTHTGPHRDDLRLTLDGIDVREAASQGEQRTVLLSLLLATATSSLEGGPILLMDDVMSELDDGRRRALVSLLLSGGQSIITTTDLHHFTSAEIEGASVVRLER